jgi:glycosyltransferase involved in cell wall biosynthesis
VSSYPPNRARLSEYAENLVRELAKRPMIEELTLLADKAEGSKVEEPENSKVKVLRVWKRDGLLSILGVMFQILRQKPDVVHFNIGFQSFGKGRLSNFAGISLVFLCRLCNLRTVVVLHNLGETVDLKKVGSNPSFVNRTGIVVATRLVLTASRVVVMVRSYAEFLRKQHGHKGVLFIPHGAPSDNCLLIDPEDKVVLIFGHMGPSKGLPVMLQAFAKMLKERSDVKLVVAGDNHPNFPNYLDKFIKAAPPKVVFTGYVPEENLCRVFRMADVVVTPYLIALGTSGAFHLACGFGKPIVSSDLPEIREILDDGASAVLVSPGDVDALKNAILKVLFDGEEAAIMQEQNLRFARRESWGAVAEAYEKVYVELMNS